MPLRLEESRARNVPVSSKLLIKVATKSADVNATGLVEKPTGASQPLKHAEIMNRVQRVTLTKTGRYIARITVILNAATSQTAAVEYSIEDSGGKQIKSFKPTFVGRSVGNDKFIGRAKYVITVV